MTTRDLICTTLTTMAFLMPGWVAPHSLIRHSQIIMAGTEQAPILDEVEPNDSRGRATEIPSGTPFVRASIEPVGDVDFFSFTANRGDYVFVSIDTTPSTTSRDSTLRLLSGRRTIGFDDDHGPNPQASGLAAVQVSQRGTYHLEVREGRDNETISSYHLFLCVLPEPIRAEAEPNDAPERASTASNVNVGVIGTTGDEDVWQFPASAMDTLSVGLDQTGAAVGFDAVMELRDPTGALVARQNNNGGEPGGAEFINVLNLPLSGVYTVRISQTGMNPGSNQFDYLMGICLNGRPLRRPPRADAGPDQGVFEGAPVRLDGSGSEDEAGGELTFRWTQVEGQNIPQVTEMASFLDFTAPMVPVSELRTYVFELRVTNSFGLSATDQVTVRVSDHFMLKDDTTPNQVLLNLAVPEFTWTTPTGSSIRSPMEIFRNDNNLIVRSMEGLFFEAGADRETRNGKAVLQLSGATFVISDANFDDSQGP